MNGSLGKPDRAQGSMIRGKKHIKRDILDKFRSLEPLESDSLPPSWLEAEYLPTLSPEEQRICRSAVRELVEKGICAPPSPAPGPLMLTEKGRDLLWG